MSRRLFALVCLAVLGQLVPTAHAEPPPGGALYAVVVPVGGNRAAVVLLCETTHTDPMTATTLACDLYDSSGRPSIHHEMPVRPAGCVVVADDLVLPIEYCATLTTTYPDGSSQTRQQCGHTGGTPPPHTPPGPGSPGVTACTDPAG